MTIRITFDPAKRGLTLKHRGLDFARAGEVFAGQMATIVDDRFDYGETRLITAGDLDGRLMVTVWTHKRVHARLRRAMAKKPVTSFQ